MNRSRKPMCNLRAYSSLALGTLLEWSERADTWWRAVGILQTFKGKIPREGQGGKCRLVVPENFKEMLCVWGFLTHLEAGHHTWLPGSLGIQRSFGTEETNSGRIQEGLAVKEAKKQTKKTKTKHWPWIQMDLGFSLSSATRQFFFFFFFFTTRAFV